MFEIIKYNNILLLLLLFLLLDSTFSTCNNLCSLKGECTSEDSSGYCICNMGFAGDDCSRVLCPRGYEPYSLISNSNRRTIRLTIGNKGGFNAGKYSFSFSGANIYLNSNTTVDDTIQCNKKISKLKSIKNAECVQEFTNSSSGIGSYLITILEYPTLPYLNNLYDHEGSPSLENFKCDASSIDDEFAIEPYCIIEDVISTHLPLYQECAGHGLCNTLTGICKCSTGYNGINCADTKDDEDKIIYGTDVHLPNFKGNLLELKVERDMSPDFNILSSSILRDNITTIRGDGLLEHNYNLVVDNEVIVGENDVTSSLDSTFGSIIPTKGLEDKKFHILSSYNNRYVFSLDNKGNLDINDDLIAHSFSITNGEMELKTSTLLQGELIGGNASLGDVFIKVHDNYNKETSNIVSFRKSDTLLSINQVHDSMIPLITITSDNSSPSSFLNINNNDINKIEINKDGMMKIQNIHMNVANMNVVTNNHLNIKAGGMEIMNGGLIIENGNIVMNKQEFSSGSINTESSHKQDSLIKTNPNSDKYAGNIIELKNNFGNTDINGAVSHILTAKNGNDYLIDIHSDGNVITLGDMNIKGNAGLSVNSHTAFSGGLSLHQSTVIASTIESIFIPSSSSYVVIKDDGVNFDKNDHNIIQNKVSMSTRYNGAIVGQIVIITNLDRQDITGDISLPSGSTLLFIFDGTRWVDIEALKAPIIQNFKKIKTLKMNNNIDIGNHEFASGRLKSNSMRINSIPVIDGNGEFQDPEKFFYSNSILSFPSLKTARFLSDIDLNGNNLNNSVMSNASVINSLMTSNRVKIDKQFGLAYFLSTGELVGAPSITLNELGKLVIKELSTDLDLNSFKLLNVDLNCLGISDSMIISTNNLKLLESLLEEEKDNENITSNRKSMNKGILFADSNNIMKTISDDINTIMYNNSDSSFTIDKLSISSIEGSINGNRNIINNMNMKTGKLRDVTTLSVNKEVLFLFDKEINDNAFLDKNNTEMNVLDTLLIEEKNSKKKIQDLKNIIEKFVNDKNRLEEILFESDKLSNSYTVDLNGFNDELSQYIQLNQPMEEKILALKELINSYKFLLVEKNEKLQGRIDARNTIKSLLSGTNGDSSMSNLIESLERDVIKEDNSISQIQTDINKINEDISKEYSNIAEIERNNKEMLEKIKETTDKINKYKNSHDNQPIVTVDEIKSNIYTLKNDIERFTKNLDELNSNILELQRNIDHIRIETNLNDNANGSSNDNSDKLLGINRQGILFPIESRNENLLEINNLNVESLFLLDSIDGNDNLLKNVKFEGQTVDFGNPSILQVGDIRLNNCKYNISIDNYSGIVNSNYESFVIHDNDGKINLLNDITFFRNKDKSGDELLIKSINNPRIIVESDLIFGGLDLNSKFLSTDSDGKVISGKNSTMSNVNIEKIINIDSDASIILSNIQSSLLITNSNGDITSSSESNDINIQLNTLQCYSAKIETININKAYIKDISIPSFSNNYDMTSLLSIQSDGKMILLDRDQKISLPSSTTTSLGASVDILAKSIFITDEVTIKLSNEFPLTISPTGKISYIEALNLDRLETINTNSNDLNILNKIKLADNFFPSSVSNLLSINGDNNEVNLISKLGIDHLEVTKNVHSSDIIVQGDLKYTGMECEKGGVLILNDGNIICSNEIKLSNLYSNTAQFSSLITDKLIMSKENDMNNKDKLESLITIDAVGRLTKMNVNDIRNIVRFDLPTEVKFDNMTVLNQLSINKNLKFIAKDSNLPDEEGFLYVDEDGTVVKLVNNELSFESVHILNDLNIDDSIETKNLIVNSLSISSIPKTILDINGKLKTENRAISSNAKGSISGITNIYVNEGIDNKFTEQLTFSASKIDITANIHVSGQVYVAGSANIEGSVIGSGPYMDSSDVRLKKNIISIPPSTSLDQIMKLKPYHYYLRSDEFPSKNFETKKQIGWIADDVQEIIPELVQVDKDGFLSVSYARTNVLIASALIELRAESEKEIKEIQNEINELNILLEELTASIE